PAHVVRVGWALGGPCVGAAASGTVDCRGRAWGQPGAHYFLWSAGGCAYGYPCRAGVCEDWRAGSVVGDDRADADVLCRGGSGGLGGGAGCIVAGGVDTRGPGRGVAAA